MLGVLSPLVQGLFDRQTDDETDDNSDLTHDQTMSDSTAIRKALSLLKALTEAIWFLVHPGGSPQDTMPTNLITNLLKECSAEFQRRDECCIADFYMDLFGTLSAGLSGMCSMCSNFAVQSNFGCLVTQTCDIHRLPFQCNFRLCLLPSTIYNSMFKMQSRVWRGQCHLQGRLTSAA